MCLQEEEAQRVAGEKQRRERERQEADRETKEREVGTVTGSPGPVSWSVLKTS